MSEADSICARALALVGTKFRLGGRDPAQGLDCIGLATASLWSKGEAPDVPSGYRLRGGSLEQILAVAEQLDMLRLTPAQARPGDVLLLKVAPIQWHFALLVPGGFVHAHAGLRRIVRASGGSPWPVIAVFRTPVLKGS